MMINPVVHAVGVPLDQAIIDTVCTDCRMHLHKLHALLEQEEAEVPSDTRDEHVYVVAVRCYRALHRLGAHVHVCPMGGVDEVRLVPPAPGGSS